ncbi:conserved protein of unknown function [Kyrpidia spormannii]|uniref:Uncharacterized protein n=2 Tax=Kyrpidia spormannii TaxID=2055160 RepID=A0ACA8Z8A6_9BACL|nr:conserved protein of unknown function [Kyrpidia spormannii]CAB3392829.1 conserved protein of unknown function [Kyrpidia spormannii]
MTHYFLYISDEDSSPGPHPIVHDPIQDFIKIFQHPRSLTGWPTQCYSYDNEGIILLVKEKR